MLMEAKESCSLAVFYFRFFKHRNSSMTVAKSSYVSLIVEFMSLWNEERSYKIDILGKEEKSIW